jgi:hypothetical protein
MQTRARDAGHIGCSQKSREGLMVFPRGVLGLCVFYYLKL